MRATAKGAVIGPPPPAAFALREDGSFALREDGSKALREAA